LALTAVLHVLLDAEDQPRTGVLVTAELVAPYGYLAGSNEEVIDAVIEESDDTGLVTLNLIPTSQYVWQSAVYKVTWDGLANPKFITVPTTGPVNLIGVLTAPPAAGPVTIPGLPGDAGRGIASTTYNAGTGLVTVNYTDGLNPSVFAMAQGTPGVAGRDFGYADATDSAYAGGAVTGPTPATDPALSINAAIANAAGRPAIVKPGVYYCQSQIFFTASNQRLHLMEGAVLVKDFTGTTGSGWGTFFITHGTAARTVKLNDLQISGPGKLTTSAGNSGGMISLWGDRQRHSDYTIDEWRDSLAWLIGGDTIRMRNVRSLTPGTFYNPNTGLTDYLSAGGLRFAAGRDFVCSDSHIVAGDDCLQAVPLQATFAHPFKNQDIDGARYIGCTGRSMAARFMAVVISDKTPSTPGMTCSVKDVRFIGCRGFGGSRGVAVRNETPSTGLIDGVTFIDSLIDQSLATLGTATADMYVQRQDATGAVRNIIFEGMTVRAPQGVALQVLGSDAYPVENVQLRRGQYAANASAQWVLTVGGVQDVLMDGVTTDGGGTVSVVQAGLTASSPAKGLRIRDCRFLAVPGLVNYASINLNIAPAARVTGSRWQGGAAGTQVRAVRAGAASLNVLVENSDLTDLISSGYWSVLPDTRLRGNVGDAEDSGLQPLRENVRTVANAGTAQTLPDPRIQTVAHYTLSVATLTLTVWAAQEGLSSSLTIRQGSGVGSRLVTWAAPSGTTIKWATADGNPPTLSTGVNKEDHISFYCDRTGVIVGVPGPMGL